MKISVSKLWSPDIKATDGQPSDPENFKVLVTAELKCEDWKEPQVFYFTVVSPSMLSVVTSGTFIRNTLVLSHFSWTAISARLEKLVAQCSSAKNFEEVERVLNGYLEYGQ